MGATLGPIPMQANHSLVRTLCGYAYAPALVPVSPRLNETSGQGGFALFLPEVPFLI
jgi:hypothetical protein